MVAPVDFRPLLYFVTVARLGSFTRAGEQLHVTQPTISKMIRNLEEELGVTLLHRSTKSVRLTDAGEAVLAQARQIVDGLESLPSHLADVIHLRKGTLRVGVPPMAGALYFPEIMARFHERFPQVDIQLSEVGALRQEVEVDEGSLDLGITILPTDETRFHTYPLVKEPLRVVMAAQHRWAGRQQISLSEMREEPLIFYREDFALHGIIRRECQHLGFQPQVVCQSGQWDFIREMAAAGLGVALMPATVCRELDPRRLTAVDLINPTIYWDLAVIWRRERYLSFAAREWLALTQATFPLP